MNSRKPILVTGAAGRLGSVGFKIVEMLREQKLPVRALVRRLDDRSEALKNLGAEIVKGDLTDLKDMHAAIEGCGRLYFGMAVADNYLEAVLNTAAVAKHHAIEAFVNISQMTVSQMSMYDTTDSTQQKFHWLSEQALNWSGLPVVHLRATVFLEHFFFNEWAKHSIETSAEIKAPFANGKTSPIATYDVARVATEVLINPASHIGKVYELTGPKSQDMSAIADEYSRALGKKIKYINLNFDDWKSELEGKGLPPHVANHLTTMAWLHHENRYDRESPDVFKITGHGPLSIGEWLVKFSEVSKQKP